MASELPGIPITCGKIGWELRLKGLHHEAAYGRSHKDVGSQDASIQHCLMQLLLILPNRQGAAPGGSKTDPRGTSELSPTPNFKTMVPSPPLVSLAQFNMESPFHNLTYFID